jgi:RNA polymerase sigma-B factor
MLISSQDRLVAPEGAGLNPLPASGAENGRRVPVDEVPDAVLQQLAAGPRGARDQDAQERTRELLSRVRDATVQERRLIRDEVVTQHLWLADKAARRYGPRSQHEDLVQVARIGLMEAFDRYDPTQTSYAYFAWVTMTGLLRRYLRDHGWSVRPPRSTQEAANTLRAALPDLTQELGRTPTTTDLTAYLGWTPAAVDAARKAELGLQAASTDALVGDTWVPEQSAEWHLVETRVLLRRAAQDLTEAERDLLRMRFGQEMTQAQIAGVIGVTQMQVSRLLARLMAKLRTRIGELDDTSPGG